MPQYGIVLKALVLYGIIIGCNITAANAQQLRLKAAGDSSSGFLVNVYDGNRLLISNTEELSLHLSNLDLSENIEIAAWKGSAWTGNDSMITLSGERYVSQLDLNLSIHVTYQVINRHVIKKTVNLFQSGMPLLYYIMNERTKPAETPVKYVTFEHDDFPGGLVHEMFPAAGFVTPDHMIVGVLTDAGYKNQYTRTTRRRFNGRGGGFVGMRKLPDPELMSVATLEDRANHRQYIQQTFGEMYDLDNGTETVLNLPRVFRSIGGADIKTSPSLITLHCDSSGKAGVEFFAPLKEQHIYTISMLCKGNTPLALKLYRVKNGKKTVELEDGIKYIDNFPAQADKWSAFKGSIMLPYIEGDSISVFIGSLSGTKRTLQLKDLKIVENHPKKEPYNTLPLGQKRQKITYLFVEPWKSHRDFMISAQSRLAEGMGLRGSLIEKMMYANYKMLAWITSVNDFKPFTVPNMNYSPDMYNRDAFWSTVSTYDQSLNVGIWKQWANTQTPEGAIATIITPYMGSVEAKDNEATIEWLIWALLNKRRFGVTLPEEKIKKAVNYILNEFDPDHDGICQSHFSMSQVDVREYHPKTDRLAVNQGMFAIALRTIQALGFHITDEYIARAEEDYRDFYDVKRKHLLFDRKYPDIISVTDLMPEFLSLWLFKRPMLTDEMVINHLNQIPLLNKVPDSPHPEYGTTAPICIRLTHDKKGYAYLNTDYQPFGKFGEENYKGGANDGYYYNGGSWLRPEYCAYVVGLKHGWKKAKALMENRAWAEINLNPAWPFSKEFIPTKWTTTASWWPSTKGLSWNVFILMADEVAGLRKPEMDPDYHSGRLTGVISDR
jgi:hypothetical protein